MPTLQYIIRCAAGRSTCITVYKCCCFDPYGNEIVAPGVTVTIKLGDTTIASGTTDGNGKFCFRPCTGGSYTVILGAQGVCVGGTYPFWGIGTCGGPDISITQALTPGYGCCNGIQIPRLVLVSDANGSFVGTLGSGADAFAPALEHAGDMISEVTLGLEECTTEDPVDFGTCCAGFVGDCAGAAEVYGIVTSYQFFPASAPFSYGYGLTCSRDEGGVYLQASIAWPFSLGWDVDWADGGTYCCFDIHGNFISGPGGRTCKDDWGIIYSNVYVPNPVPGSIPFCILTNPHPVNCQTHAWYGGPSGYVARATSNKIYMSPVCSLQTGSWTFSFTPDPDPFYGVPPRWAFLGTTDCANDHTIAPPPPGGTSITVSGYFP